jgi:uncharacterized cupin superfamily protein
MSDSPYLIRREKIREGRKRFRHPWNPDSEVVFSQMAPLTGLKRTGVTLVSIPPGKESFVPHVHYREEEWVYVLSGTGTALIGDDDYAIEAGDFMGFPPGTVAHNLKNTGDETLVYLMGGEALGHEIADFPGLGRRMVRRGETMEIYDVADGRPMEPVVFEEVGDEDEGGRGA